MNIYYFFIVYVAQMLKQILLLFFTHLVSAGKEKEEIIVLDGITNLNPEHLWENDKTHCAVCLEVFSNIMEDMDVYGDIDALSMLFDSIRDYPVLIDHITPNIGEILQILEVYKTDSSLMPKLLCRRLERSSLDVCKIEPIY